MVSLNREKTMYSQKGRTFIVERIRPSGKYGKAYGKCLVDGIPNDEYSEQYDSEIMDGEIPCARCGGWVLIDVPGVDMDKLFPYRPPKFVMNLENTRAKQLEKYINKTLSTYFGYWIKIIISGLILINY